MTKRCAMHKLPSGKCDNPASLYVVSRLSGGKPKPCCAVCFKVNRRVLEAVSDIERIADGIEGALGEDATGKAWAKGLRRASKRIASHTERTTRGEE